MTRNVFVTAFTRAILGRAVANPSTVKFLTAVRANESAAVITELSGWRACEKIVTAQMTLLRFWRRWNTARFKQVRISVPDCVICFGMTGRTKGNEVVEDVGFVPIIKEVIRLDVMDVQPIVACAAVLTGVIVSFTSLCALLFPVSTSVLRVTTKPGRIILSTPIIGRPPLPPALAITEVVLTNGVRLTLDFFTASITNNRNALSTNSTLVLTLPQAVALGRAKPGGLRAVRFNIE